MIASKTNIAVMLVYVAFITPRTDTPDIFVGNTVAQFNTLPIAPVDAEYVTDARAGQWFKFQNLARRWQAERGARSSITAMSMLPAYQSIIGMGEEAVPLIIAQLRLEGDDPDHWFWALRAITEANPISPEDRGDSVKMAQSWIKWAENEGYAG